MEKQFRLQELMPVKEKLNQNVFGKVGFRKYLLLLQMFSIKTWGEQLK
jgi:hypothetical protein